MFEQQPGTTPAQQQPAAEGTTPQDFASKYQNELELRNGYNSLIPEFDRVKSDNAALRQRLDQQSAQLAQTLERVDAVLQSGAVQMPGSQPRTTALDQLAEQMSGGTVDKTTLANALAEMTAQQVNAAFNPLVRGIEARQTIAREAPDYLQNEGKIQQFLQENPQLDQRFRAIATADPAAAMDYAHKSWRMAQPQQTVSASGADQAQARLDSAMQSGGGNGVGVAGGDALMQQYAQLRKAYQDMPSPANQRALESFVWGPLAKAAGQTR